jgi:hypothetical protein
VVRVPRALRTAGGVTVSASLMRSSVASWRDKLRHATDSAPAASFHSLPRSRTVSSMAAATRLQPTPRNEFANHTQHRGHRYTGALVAPCPTSYVWPIAHDGVAAARRLVGVTKEGDVGNQSKVVGHRAGSLP